MCKGTKKIIFLLIKWMKYKMVLRMWAMFWNKTKKNETYKHAKGASEDFGYW